MTLLDRKTAKNQGITTLSTASGVQARCGTRRADKEKSVLAPARMTDNQNGSALIWIFIMIFLFGALTYALSDGTRSSSTAMTDQQISLAASEILDYSRAVKSTIHELRINGCTDTEISFENPIVAGYTNANAPTDNSCHVFHPSGGGLRNVSPEESWLSNNYAPALMTAGRYGVNYFVSGYPIVDISSTEPELLLVINFIRKDLCMQINETLGVQNLTDDTPEETVDAPTVVGEFTGTYGATIANKLGDDTDGYLTGKNAVCWKNAVNDVYQFYQVLIAR